MRIFAYLGGEGVIVSWWNFPYGRVSRHNNPCKFWWRSVQRFRGFWGSGVEFPTFSL